MSEPRNPYDVLNVAQFAEPVVVEAAYRALMKKYHPDQGEGAAHSARAAEINHAFAVLKDPGQRAAYDHMEWKRQQAIRSFAAMPPPRRRLSGWTGWLLAGVLGLILTAVTIDPDGLVARPKPSNFRFAGAVEPGSGSQPPHADTWVALTEGSDQIRTDVLATAAAAVGTANAMPVAAVPADMRAYAAPAKQLARPKKRRPRGKQRATAATPQADFLEREGYIY